MRFASTLTLLTLTSIANADFVAPSISGGFAWNRPTTASTTSTFQAWDVFTSTTGPNAPQIVYGFDTGDTSAVTTGSANTSKGFGGDATATWPVINLSGTANAFDAAAPANGAFATSGGNIYSPAGVVQPRIIVPNNMDGGTGDSALGSTTLILQIRTQGEVLNLSSVKLTDPVSGLDVSPTSSVLLASAPLGGFGGVLEDRLFTFTVPGNADAYTFNMSAAGSSMSLDRIAVDTHYNPVPEPSLLFGILIASVLSRSVRRRSVMLRSFLIMLVGAGFASAHFVYVVPSKDGVKVVLSDSLDVDEAVTVEKIAGLKLTLKTADGKDAPITLMASEHSLSGSLEGKPRIAFGSVAYGVMKRGDAKPFLLEYLPKTVWAGATKEQATLGTPLEIVPVVKDGKATLLVLASGKPVAGTEVSVIGQKDKLKTDDTGTTPAFDANGLIGAWAKTSEAKTGDLKGEKYEEIRHYATLVFDATKSLPSLPTGVSSLGAATCDGYVYVYGGHAGKTHSYDTTTALGTFQRLKLDGGTAWEALPGSTGMQGLALVEHKGSIIRIGGMIPKNAPGEPADLLSTADVAKYDPKAKAWTKLPEMPAPRSSHDAWVIGDKLYVVGGWQMNGKGAKSVWCDHALVLDLAAATTEWKKIEQPFQRRALTCAAVGTKLYVVGGLDESAAALPTVNVFDTATSTWSKGPDLPGKRTGFSPAAAVLGGKLYVSSNDGKVHRLSGEKWEEAATSKTTRMVHRLVPHGTNLILVGGAGGGGNHDDLEAVEIK